MKYIDTFYNNVIKYIDIFYNNVIKYIHTFYGPRYILNIQIKKHILYYIIML